MTPADNRQRPRRVLLVIRHPVGGIRTYIKYVYKRPYFDDYRFTVILPHGSLTHGLFHPQQGYQADYIECEDNAQSLALAVYTVLRKTRYDLLHAHGFTSGVCALLPARLHGVPQLMTSHDVLSEKQFRGARGFLKRQALPLVFNRMNLIHSVSHDAERNLIELLPGINKKKLVTILNGIDISLYAAPGKRDFHTELDLPSNAFLIGFLGRFMSQKGFRYLIDAIDILNRQQDLPAIPLVVALGYGGFIREDREIIAARRLEQNFIFLPAVDNVADSLKGMDVIAIPSLWEACPLLPMEALVSGVPLIASTCMGLREVTTGSPAFTVAPANAHELADAIRQCMQDDRRKAFDDYAPVARSRFDAARTSGQLQQAYDRLTRQGS